MVLRTSSISPVDILDLSIRAAEQPLSESASQSEQIKELIQEISADLEDLESFYNVKFSRTRLQRMGEYLVQRETEIVAGFSGTWNEISEEGKVDWLLIFNHIRRELRRIRVQWKGLDEMEPVLGGWAMQLVELCEKRQKIVPVLGKDAAQVLTDAYNSVDQLQWRMEDDATNPRYEPLRIDPLAAYRSAIHVAELRSHLEEWYEFYKGYDPTFTWWIRKPWENLSTILLNLSKLIRERLVGIKPGDEDTIVGQPIGEEAILDELKAEVIPYSPEELLQIAEKEYSWCENEAIKASQEMGHGSNWRAAQEQVKNAFVPPGQQPQMVHDLAREAVDYITKRDMVTIPRIANECWRTNMIVPAQQKVSPFFLGGTSMNIAYPTDDMSHEDKLMIMRGNNRHFSRSTVFHEMVPGHHLQFHYIHRSKPYRKLFTTPFWVEGWAFYWEMILWDRGFANTPEDRLGMLFWRMHRCARIVFSLSFHLGKMTPRECIEYLVEKVGHERATAEGEVRRSLNGSYGPLYQAGYMLGALQLYALRKEIVDTGRMSEKGFHNRVLRENQMPIEFLRALLKGEKLEQRYEAKWKFYDL